MNHSEEMNEIFAALALAQGEGMAVHQRCDRPGGSAENQVR